ncbi:MAG: DUF1622 domain-containing protein [candidate division WS1 bacterium]|jgi:uncharacterized membrane protein|nr:DUF1622 domain-containing protein [candidate division WS1 bacterium]
MLGSEWIGTQIIGWVATAVGVIGVGVLTWGVLVGLVELARLEVHRMRGRDIAHERAVVRQDLGYYILLGLEFLIAADIMRTIRHPTLDELATLAGIVLIRTVISYYLTHEMREAGRLEGWRNSGKSPSTAEDAVGDTTD